MFNQHMHTYHQDILQAQSHTRYQFTYWGPRYYSEERSDHPQQKFYNDNIDNTMGIMNLTYPVEWRLWGV